MCRRGGGDALAWRRMTPGVARSESRRREAAVLAVVALGGMLGASARYGVARAITVSPGELPWGTFAVNVSGCLLIGALMVLLLEVLTAHRLVRPFLGVGVLGGYTTFSTYAVDVVTLSRAGRPLLAAAYLLGTVVAALVAVELGAVAARASARVARGARRRRARAWVARAEAGSQLDEEEASG